MGWWDDAKKREEEICRNARRQRLKEVRRMKLIMLSTWWWRSQHSRGNTTKSRTWLDTPRDMAEYVSKSPKDMVESVHQLSVAVKKGISFSSSLTALKTCRILEWFGKNGKTWKNKLERKKERGDNELPVHRPRMCARDGRSQWNRQQGVCIQFG